MGTKTGYKVFIVEQQRPLQPLQQLPLLLLQQQQPLLPQQPQHSHHPHRQLEDHPLPCSQEDSSSSSLLLSKSMTKGSSSSSRSLVNRITEEFNLSSSLQNNQDLSSILHHN